MKKILLATSILAGTAGFAAAEVTLSGDARMGIISAYDNPLTLADDENDLAFTSRARVKFTMSGSTDGGLEFGASFRADNAAGASSGTAGSVFISGAFGKLSMGDVDDAANSAVGQVSGVGLTGLGDVNEVTYIGGGLDPTALYEYSTGDLTIYASVTNPTLAPVAPDTTPAGTVAYSVAAKYALGDYTVALGYENNDVGTDHIIVGGSATFGAATVKAIYGDASGAVNGSQYAVSVDYKADALTVTAFYADDSELGGAEGYGLGASYDLGGGASVVGGYSHNETANDDAYDIGVSMSF